MTTRTDTAPVARQHLRQFQPDPTVALWRDLLAARHFRGIGTIIRCCAAAVILFYAMTGRG